MANEEHLKILRQGVEVWNRWREKHPEIRPDLYDANCYGISLRGINLAGADLRNAIFSMSNLFKANLSSADLVRAHFVEAKLYSADFSESNLSKADLNNADLSEANLIVANLQDADFTGADLSKANIKGAILVRTNLCDAKLISAHLDSAILGGTILGNTALNNARGLDSCFHSHPSIIDHQTLAKSGKLPLKFIRGCGMPEIMIEFILPIFNDPIQFQSCFISYSSKDQSFAERLYADLQNRGVRCWFAPEDLPIGARLRQTIDESIHVHDRLLLILSEHSICSDWVEKEVETAMEREREERRTILFPIRLDDQVMNAKFGWAADIHRTRNIGDFKDWINHDTYQKALARLLHDLKSKDLGANLIVSNGAA